MREKPHSGIFDRLYQSVALKSIRQGLILAFPMIVVGSISLIFNSLPIQAYQSRMLECFGADWQRYSSFIWEITFGMIGLILAITISYNVARQHALKNNRHYNPIIVSILSLFCFLVVVNDNSLSISIEHTGQASIFFAIVSALLSSYLFIGFERLFDWLRKKMQRQTLHESYASFYQAIHAILPVVMTTGVFIAMKYLLVLIGVSDINQVLQKMAVNLFSQIGSPFLAGLLFILLHQLFWFFGVHGGAILSPVSETLFIDSLNENFLFAAGAGASVPNIVTKPFIDVFVLIGGAGTTIGLIAAIFLIAKQKNARSLAKLSLIPALFNINEIVVFGLPVILNPVFLIPYIFIPALAYCIAFAATAWGLVPATCSMVNWTTPPIVGGYLATGSWRGIVLQITNIAVSTAAYMPFVKWYTVQSNKKAERAYQRLKQHLLDSPVNASEKLLLRDDVVGHAANRLAGDIEMALKNKAFHLEYQPQVDADGRVTGVEALLRWKHPLYGMVPPPLIIRIAEEAELICALGDWVIDQACFQLALWGIRGIDRIEMAVNLSALQLSDDAFIENLKKTIRRYEIDPRRLELEITETTPLADCDRTKRIMQAINALGIGIALDDFGMGYTSLMYMRSCRIQKIKMDRSLTIDIVKDVNCRDIIATIVYLAKMSGTTVLSEHVEVQEQVEMLKAIGCFSYQGHLFSPALSAEACAEYIMSHQGVEK